ncbi:MAG: response regulator [Chitinivibrionales bacterium]|nr:response regulator [Chitinivibrionales bacterium]MBD3356510.1 response regulator [Chitinivibrionales bacterium]
MTIQSGKKDHVLVVDDEKSICDIVSHYLSQKGLTVHQADGAEKAVELIQSQAIGCVLSDIKMPGMTGVDLLKWIKEYDQFLPVIITTGYPTLETAIEALKLGAFDYLTKPFHLEEIGEKINRALRNRQLQEENLLLSKLVALHEVTKVLSTTHRIGELNGRFLDFSTRMAKADRGALMFVDGSSKLLLARTFPPSLEKNFWAHPAFLEASHWVTEHEEPLVVEAGSETIPDGIPSPPTGILSYIIFPLKTPKRTLGVLNLVRLRDSNAFSNVDLEIVNVLASQASISIENTRLYQSLQDNYLKTIRGFALAVEAKDKYTHGHSENVMKYTIVLAQHLGLSNAEIERIKYAGLLHDIGKIGVGEAILNKPGKLTPMEFDEIKKHPELGARIISDVPFLKSLAPMVRHHHEFYDGNGYPEGIRGEDIPYGARILSVADAYEAMTSNRPYRKSMPSEIAMEIVIKEKGRQFDPAIVDAFCDIVQTGVSQ